MQNQSIPPLSGAGPAATPSDPGPVQGGGFNAPSVSDKNFIFRNKRLVKILILLGLFLVAGLIVITMVFFKKPPADLAAKVGDQEITKAQVEGFSFECGVEQKEAVEYLVDEIVLSKWAEAENITVSAEEQRYPEEEVENIQLRPCEITLEKVNQLREKLSQDAIGYREGKFIAVNFDRYNPGSLYAIPEATEEAQRNRLITEERSYADNLIQSINQDLGGEKITFEEAMAKVNQDQRVGTNSRYSTSIRSGDFSAEDYLSSLGLLAKEETRKKIDSLSSGQISEPFIEQVNISRCDGEDGCQPQYKDARWIIVKIDRIEKGGEKVEDILSKTRQKYDAKIYLR